MTAVSKNIIILGAAESGVGAALLAQAKGHTTFVSDRGPIQPQYKEKLTQAGIEFEENQHSLERILQADEVIKSPGIPEKAAVIKALREKNIAIISEIEFASRYTKARFIAITGTNGKTTTTLLTYHLLKEAGLSVGLAGNIGYSLAEQVIADKFAYYVLEISSFQLDDTKDFHPWISLLLNITPDHLDRYDYSLAKYAEAKLRIAENLVSDDYLIYNADDETIERFLKTAFMTAFLLPFSLHHRPDYHLAAYYEDEYTLRLNLPTDDQHPEKVSVKSSPLIGQHNHQNMAAAILAARVAGVSPQQLEAALRSFKNADHRLQLVRKISDIQYINDSKATNVEAAWYALDGIKRPIVWIAGGTDKGNDYATLQPLAEQKVKALICLGVDNTKLRAAFESHVPHFEETQSMTDAVRRAAALAAPGDVVLLSPCCASFDLFKNYEDRGRQFAAAVQAL
ncbi:UDP-N-acetylmuramoyl-L-alanine--D-glutamate ligase [Hymenobacter sp. BRD67]|uniref:UDP-N-acetylmuramoyl-L-alanine--D-glutamate ligase n=1 Tax=Hymenobacter sp. BRD67 TaxID=2675877 RepID=UPI001563E085|nr:UDP-N-acetylmuramoyl-L-alanine--D-glutamate ligase [Hymenobacter sp. BRD67]QKG51447.1 UDP-N-acetylmuramoyl-L-alanine--D-glutamate ligase [Hymenobacter sp. BRD67]